MSTSRLYHNPRCSKSREALALLAENEINPTVVLYLEQTPSADEISQLLASLGFNDARQLMRKSEADYAALGLDNPTLSQAELIAALVAHPRLIERPVFCHQGRAVIGRPPARVLEIV